MTMQVPHPTSKLSVAPRRDRYQTDRLVCNCLRGLAVAKFTRVHGRRIEEKPAADIYPDIRLGSTRICRLILENSIKTRSEPFRRGNHTPHRTTIETPALRVKPLTTLLRGTG